MSHLATLNLNRTYSKFLLARFPAQNSVNIVPAPPPMASIICSAEKQDATRHELLGPVILYSHSVAMAIYRSSPPNIDYIMCSVLPIPLLVVQVKLPDMELIVNLGDWPLNKRGHQPAFPVFSWCGSENTRDIIWPTWDLMKATIMGMDRWVGHGQVGTA